MGLGIGIGISPTLGQGVGSNLVLNATGQGVIRAMIAAVKGGTSKRMAILGDSTEAGLFSTGRTKAPAAILRGLQQTAGVPSRSDAWFGNSNMGYGGAGDFANYTAYNPNVVFGTGWAPTFSFLALGRVFYTTVSGDGLLTFTPEKACDRFDFYYVTSTGNGTLVIKDGATTLATVNTNGTFGLAKVAVTRASATTNPITIQHNGTGSTAYISGMVPWNSTLGELNIINLANTGWRIWDFFNADTVISSSAGLDQLAPDFCLLDFGINDFKSGDTLGNVMGYLQFLMDKITAWGGKYALATPNPAGGAYPDYNVPADWIAAIIAKAAANNASLADVNRLYGSYASRPTWYGDGIHPNDTGYAQKGALFDALLRA